MQQNNVEVRQTEVSQQLCNLHNSIDSLKEFVSRLCSRLQSVSTCKPCGVSQAKDTKNQVSLCPLAKEILSAEDKVNIVRDIVEGQINDLEV